MLFLFINVLTYVLAVLAKEKRLCTYPPYPTNGGYTVDGNPSTPKQTVDSYRLKVSCNPGHQLVGEEIQICYKGQYLDVMPECIPMCQVNTTTTTTISCGDEESTCYYPQTSDSTGGEVLHCNRNRRTMDEHSECGKDSPFVVITSEGVTTQRRELPWHAGIFTKRSKPYMQICGGTLISTTVVISAAHCFWDNLLKKLPAEDYAVALGKIYRPWDDPNDDLVQKSNVSEIRIPPRFLGSATNFQEDLALVVLSEPVSYTHAVRPMCLNFDYEFDVEQLKTGALGKVSGWGLDGQNGRASPKLQVAYLPYIDIETCVADSTPDFQNYLTGDKICAGYTNGTAAVCKGDSGGGLSFYDESTSRYYLRGVVSAAPKTDQHLCSVYRWATFTHLLRHQHFIQALVGKNKKS